MLRVASDDRDCSQLAEFALAAYYSNLISALSKAAADEERQPIARAYYGNLFVVWHGTSNPRVAQVCALDMSGFVRGYHRAAAKFSLADLLDAEDPLGWRNTEPSLREEVADTFGGPAYFKWVLETTHDEAQYEKDARNFREFLDRTGKQ